MLTNRNFTKIAACPDLLGKSRNDHRKDAQFGRLCNRYLFKQLLPMTRMLSGYEAIITP